MANAKTQHAEKASVGSYLTALHARYQRGLPEATKRSEIEASNSFFATLKSLNNNEPDSAAAELLNTKWFPIILAMNSETLSEQQRIIHAVSSTDEQRVIASKLAVGDAFLQTPLKEAAFSTTNLSAEDASIVLETEMLQAHSIDEPALSAYLPVLSTTIDEFRARRKLPALGDVESLVNFCRALGVPMERTNWHSMRTGIKLLKQKWLHVIGPDFFSSLQLAFEPKERLSEPILRHASMVLSLWKADHLFIRMVSTRAHLLDSQASQLIGDMFTRRLRDQKPRRTQKLIASLLLRQSPAVPPRKPLARDFLSELFFSTRRVECALNNRSADQCMLMLQELYNIEPAALSFVDWIRVAQTMRHSRVPPSPLVIFTDILIEENIGTSGHNIPIFMWGTGAIYADATSFVRSKQVNRQLEPVLNALATMKGRALTKMVFWFLSRATLERLGGLFNHQSDRQKGLPAKREIETATLRMDVCILAHSKKLIGDSRRDEILDTEAKNISLAFYDFDARRGRVHLNDKALKAEIADRYGGEMRSLLDLLSLSARQFSARQVATAFHDYIGERILRFSIHDAEVFVDRALSNNLRHGVVHPRMVLAFDAAIATSRGQRNVAMPWSDTDVLMAYSNVGRETNEFRARVLRDTLNFVENDLTLPVGSAEFRALDEQFGQTLVAAFEKLGRPFKLKRSEALEMVIRSLRATLTQWLQAAGRNYEIRMREHISAFKRQLQTQYTPLDHERSAKFVHAVELRIGDAIDDIRNWINLAPRKRRRLNFDFAHVVQLELLQKHALEAANLHVRATTHHDPELLIVPSPGGVIRRIKPSSVPIRGRFFDCFDAVVANLLSNAFKYSQQDLRTRIDLALVVGSDHFSIRCRNSYAMKEYSSIKNRLKEIRQLADRVEKQGSARDKGSGFQKIREACREAFGGQPIINIGGMEERGKPFSVTLSVGKAGRELCAYDESAYN